MQSEETGISMGQEITQLGNSVKQAGRKEIREILEEQFYLCALTGVSLNPDNAQLDHIVPVAMGGTNAKDNLQIVETKVNRMKGSLSNEEFIAICKMVAATHGYPPNV